MYKTLFETEDEYLDFGLKEVFGGDDHDRNAAMIRARREGTVAPERRARQLSDLTGEAEGTGR